MAIFTIYERFYYRYFKFNIERSLRFGWDSFEIFMAAENSDTISYRKCGVVAYGPAYGRVETFFQVVLLAFL